MNEEQIIDFLITQSTILGLEKENCPYYQIMKFITADKEKICKLNKLYYEANENLIKYEKVIKQIVDYVNIDDETMEQLSIFDVNGIEIMKIIKENLK